jgi:D-alanine-D-alanine ligase
MAELGRVAVLMGGRSAEREISLQSGNAVLSALRRKGVEAEAVDLDANVLGRLSGGGFSRVFIALHGRGGEDGQIQGALETLRIPYTGSGVLGSALSMDKLAAKRVWLAVGVPTPPFMMLARGFDPEAVTEALGLPLMVKPAREGSSLGVAKVNKVAELRAAWQDASRLDDRVIAERWVTGREYTCAVLEGEALPMIRLETPRPFYDYQAKYHDDRTQYICPCGLPERLERDVQRLALQAFDALDARGWGRVDLLLDAQDRPWFIEVNTVPGMTDHSLVPMAARAAGLSFDELVVRVLQTAMLSDPPPPGDSNGGPQ